MALNSSDIGLMAFQKFLDVLRAGKAKSLAEYTQSFRAEPYVMIDNECIFLDVMYDVMQSLQSQYSAYYMLAMSAMTTINNVQVAEHMNKLNPSRSSLDAALNTASKAGGLMLAAESYREGLPGLERVAGNRLNRDVTSGQVDTVTAGMTQNSVKEIQELSNLSVGKIISCEIQDGNTKMTIPVAIRLLASSRTPEQLVHNLVGLDSTEYDTRERFELWRLGQKSLADMFLATDVIKGMYKTGMKDNSGDFRAIMQRRNKNKLASIFSLNPSVGTYSNMAVVSETTAKQIELAMKGKSLNDFKARESMFDNAALLMLCVVDRNWNQCTFYHQSIARPTKVSFRDLKASNKGSGPDVASILDAYRLGNSPTL